MKYHFRTPEEVKELYLKSRIESHPFRNRTFLMVFLNIFLVAIVFGILHFTGLLYRNHIESIQSVEYGNLRFSATVAGLRSDREEPTFYLKVQNLSDHAILFPVEKGEYHVNHAQIELHEPLVRGGGILYISDIFLEKRSIQPGETEIYKFRPALPDLGNRTLADLFYVFRVMLQGSNIEIRIPSRLDRKR